MKIVFIGGRDIFAIGGIESYVYNLSLKLIELGHSAVVYCESDHNAIVYKQGIKIIYLTGLPSNLLCKPWVGLKATIRTLIKEKNISVIHYNAWPPSLWSFIPRIFRKKTLLQEHGFEWKHTKYSPTQVKILRFMERLTAYTNTNIICVSNEQSEYFYKHYKRRATTIPTAVNLPDLTSEQSTILEKFGVLKQSYFLFMGRLSKEKNIEQLIDAFHRIEGYKLVIAGTNTVEPQYAEDLKNRYNYNNVIFTGAVYGADKSCLLENAFVFCLPSSVEGLSIALLEAMSFRLPIIASDIRANTDVLGNDAVFVHPENVNDMENAYNYCIMHKSELRLFAEKNYKKVETHYTWDNVALQYINYIRSIAKTSK